MQQHQVPTLKEKPKKLPIPVKLTVGALAGAFGTSCIFPIDMIKTRLQASSGRYTGPVDCFRQIMANEGGIRGFYKGLIPNLGGVCPEKAIKLVSHVENAQRSHRCMIASCHQRN
jgi:Mitochondrial carrier protein